MTTLRLKVAAFLLLCPTALLATQALRVDYPQSHGDPIVVEAGAQRLVLRAVADSDYEVVEIAGIDRVEIHEGAVRFLPAAQPPPAGRFRRLPTWLEIDGSWELIGKGAIPSHIRMRGGADGISTLTFRATGGNLATARSFHTATLLPKGKVLIAGGVTTGAFLSSAELYDPAEGTFAPASGMGSVRAAHTATLLRNGNVLLAGGSAVGLHHQTAELYDPHSDRFDATDDMLTRRSDHTATLLNDGTVLIVGGRSSSSNPVATAEIYDPATGLFTTTGGMSQARYQHTATLLSDGRVLIAGGQSGPSTYLTSAEIYNPSTGSFTSAPTSLGTARAMHTATLLPNGSVLFAGGTNSATLDSSELYTNGTFTPTDDLIGGRQQHTATLLPDGSVLMTGGSPATASAVRYHPSSGTYSTTNSLATPRYIHTATLLPNGEVLIAGGYNGTPVAFGELYDSTAPSSAATGSMPATIPSNPVTTLLPAGKVLVSGTGSSPPQLYDPSSGTFAATAAPSISRTNISATLLTNGKVLIAGGLSGETLNDGELYDPATDSFSDTGDLLSSRYGHTATLLSNGKVLIVGGNGLRAAELYDPATGVFTSTGASNFGFSNHTATLLPNGKVLIVGASVAELYDPVSGTFSVAGSLHAFRSSHSATLLPNGKVLIAGGFGFGAYPRMAELFDPGSGTFHPTGSMSAPRIQHTAILLPTGKVLISGGVEGSNAFASSELYDPATGTFTPTATMTAPRWAHAAMLLANGRVLLAGGNPTPSRGTAEVYDAGLGATPARTPSVGSALPPIEQPASFELISVFGFLGDSEASSGSTNSSPTNFPILHLQRVDNEQVVFPGTSTWNAGRVTSRTISGLPNGYYRLSVIINGITSPQRILLISYPAPAITSISPDSGPTNGNQLVVIEGANLGTTFRVTFGGEVAEIDQVLASSVRVFTPKWDASTQVVAVETRGGTATTIYEYELEAPPFITASINTPTSVRLDWPPIHGAARFELARSTDGVNFTTFVLTNGTSVFDNTVMAGTTYLYKVRSVDGSLVSAYTQPDMATTIIFTDSSLAGLPVKAVHINELRTAVDSVRAMAGLPPGTYTDTIVPGVTVAKAVHITELRSQLDEAHEVIASEVYNHVDPTITPGSTVIKAVHITRLRDATQTYPD